MFQESEGHFSEILAAIAGRLAKSRLHWNLRCVAPFTLPSHEIFMIYHLSLAFKHYLTWANAFHYVSFRAMAALLTSLSLSFLCGDTYIEASGRLFRAKAREWTPETHRAKDNMPTMGGLFILATVFVSCLLWCNLTSAYVWITLFCLSGFGAIGFWDDWSKIRYCKGISAKLKSRLQILVAFIVAVLLYYSGISTAVSIPLFTSYSAVLGILFIPWVMFIVVALSNAVNLTDGLDGLAIGSLIINYCTFAIIAYLAGHATLAAYLHMPLAASSEVAVIAASLVGASIGFLWYNAYPAQIFMGDVGSLALGSVLALIGIMAKQELLLPLAGGLFVIEVLSVILQVASFKYTGKRIFKMAPIHHHYELLGWPEAKIVTRFSIITLILCILALMLLKVQ